MNRKVIKILMLCLVCFMIASTSAFAYSNEPKTANEEVINVIKLLEIANGDENGNMNFDKEVTRAEFVKMIINASPSKETAANIKLNVSLFPDVKNSFWGASYISVAINNGLVNGYVDGTFKPNNTVTLEEAATIVLRLLGYTSADLVGSYPTVQLQKYEDLELCENITAVRGDKLTREECMILIYNALSTKTKQGSVYCTTLGCSANSEGVLDYSALLEDKLDGPVLVKDTKDYFKNTDFVENESTQYYLNNRNTVKAEISEYDVLYYSDVINTVFAYRKTATGIVGGTSTTGGSAYSATASASSSGSSSMSQGGASSVNSSFSVSSSSSISSSSSSTVTLSGKSYKITTTEAKAKLSFGGEFYDDNSFVTLILGINDNVVDVIAGDISKISENDSNSSLISMIDSTISKAIYLKNDTDTDAWQSKIPFDVNEAEFYFNGRMTASTRPNVHDVIYYSKAFKRIWIFRKTVSGTIEAITTRNSPSQITVSGKNYGIVSSDAAYNLSVYGQYDVGDRVTLVLGINDECVAVVDTNVTSGVVYGIVTDKGQKTYTDKNGNKYTSDYVSVADTLNNTHVYEFDGEKLNVGDAVKVSITNTTIISKLGTSIGKSDAALLSNAFENGLFTDDCEIIEFSSGATKKINPSRLSGVIFEAELVSHSNYVLYVEFEDKKIKRLMLNDYTGDFDEYGVVVATSDKSISYMIDGEKYNFSMSEGQIKKVPVRIEKNGNSVTNIRPLINNITGIISFDGNAAFDNNNRSYILADKVSYFIKNEAGYESSNIENMLSGNYEYTAYFDKDYRFGGRVRVIIATRKV